MSICVIATMRDYNMRTVLRWAQEICPLRELKTGYQQPAPRLAMLVHVIDGHLVRNTDLKDVSEAQKKRRIKDAVNMAYTFLCPDDYIKLAHEEFASIVLRYWSGCLSGAKIIALKTRSGPNTPEYRSDAVVRLFKTCKRDRFFAQGVRSAPFFKRVRMQRICYDGIPVMAKRRLFE